MKRRTYVANITRLNSDETMQEIAFKNTYAWNSGIRATEALMRDYARSTETIFEGGKPKVVGGMDDPDRQYLRYWTNSKGETIMASVWEVK